MHYGVVFPHENEAVNAGADGPRRFAVAVEEAGFSYLSSADHVLGADAVSRTKWDGPYDATNSMREVMVLFGFLAGATRLGFITSILILGQRQTALVAKQAAELDLLTGGKFRLGVGVGWNDVEYESLGIDFHTRGARYEEQLGVLRALWTENVVSFEGRFHTIDRAGIWPLPIQQPVPLWLGGVGRRTYFESDKANPGRVIDRIGRLADGWICGPGLEGELIGSIYGRIKRAAEGSGRDPSAIGVQATVRVGSDIDPGEFERAVEDRRSAGATHVSIEFLDASMSLDVVEDTLRGIGELLSRID